MGEPRRRSTRLNTPLNTPRTSPPTPLTPQPSSARTRRAPSARWAAAAAVVVVAALLTTQPLVDNRIAPRVVIAAASARATLRLTAMRFFRDVSRAKAHRRLHHDSQTSLVTILMGREPPLTVKEPDHTTAQFTVSGPPNPKS